MVQPWWRDTGSFSCIKTEKRAPFGSRNQSQQRCELYLPEQQFAGYLTVKYSFLLAFILYVFGAAFIDRTSLIAAVKNYPPSSGAHFTSTATSPSLGSPHLHSAVVNELMICAPLMSRASTGAREADPSSWRGRVKALITARLQVISCITTCARAHSSSPAALMNLGFVWIGKNAGILPMNNSSHCPACIRDWPHSACLPSPLMLLHVGFNYHFPAWLSINFAAVWTGNLCGALQKKKFKQQAFNFW